MKENSIITAVHVPPSKSEELLNGLKPVAVGTYINHPATTVTGPLDTGPTTLQFYESIYPSSMGRSISNVNAGVEIGQSSKLSGGSLWSRMFTALRDN